MIAFTGYLVKKFARERLALVVVSLPAGVIAVSAAAAAWRLSLPKEVGMTSVGAHDLLGVLIPILEFLAAACAAYLGLWACRREALDGSLLDLGLAARHGIVITLPATAIAFLPTFASSLIGLASLRLLSIDAQQIGACALVLGLSTATAAGAGCLVSVLTIRAGLAPMLMALGGAAALWTDRVVKVGTAWQSVVVTAAILCAVALTGKRTWLSL